LQRIVRTLECVQMYRTRSLLERQAHAMTFEAMLADLPCHCDVGCKRSSQGIKTAWRGDKLHLDVADSMIPVSAIVTAAQSSASMLASRMSLACAESTCAVRPKSPRI